MISAKGPPTWPSPPGIPGIVWHPPQPYRRIAAGARVGFPPVMVRATLSKRCRSRQLRPAATAIATSSAPVIEIGHRYLESAESIAMPPRRTRLPNPDGKHSHSRTGIDRPRRNPHDESGQLLVL